MALHFRAGRSDATAFGGAGSPQDEMTAYACAERNARANEFIVVLGQSLLAGGNVPVTLQARIDKAAALHHESHLPFILSGGDVLRPRAGISEAETMRRLLLQRGVEEQACLMDEQATNTIENAVNALALAGVVARPSPPNSDEEPALKFHIVTSSFHMPRALYVFEAVAKARAPRRAIEFVGHGADGGVQVGLPRPSDQRPREINDWRLAERIEHEHHLLSSVMEDWLRRSGVQPPGRQRLNRALEELAQTKSE